MAAILASRKRCAPPSISFLDEPLPAPAPPHLAKRGRFTPAPASFSAAAAPAAAPHHHHPQHQQQQQQQAVDTAARVDGDGDGMEEWAGVLVEQMSAAADVADARARACAVLKLVEAAIITTTNLASTSELREEENAAALRARLEAVERDNGVLKHGVAALHRRAEEAKREAAEARLREAELRRKVAELEAANYALAARMVGGADNCRFQAFHGPPDVF